MTVTKVKPKRQRVFEDLNHREARNRIGSHIIADFWGGRTIEDADEVERILVNATHVANARILETIKHKFTPEGITAIVMLAESHISIHTWPEYDYIAIDVFTCGKSMKPMAAIKYLKEQFKPKRTELTRVARGIRPS